MKLSDKLIKDFADAVNKKELSKKKVSTQVQGTVVKKTSKDDICVQLDGSQSTTPVKMGVGAEVDDRVLVNIEEHTATIVGNISTPAYASTSENYMRYDENGLAVGKLENGEPTGTYCIMSSVDTTFKIKNGDSTSASFGANRIEFCDGNGYMEYDGNGGLHIGSHTEHTSSVTLHAQRDGMAFSEVSLSPGEINLNTFGAINLRSDNGVYTGDMNNNEAVLSTQDIMTHRVDINVSSTPAKGYKQIETTLEVPYGHKIMGLLWLTTNHRNIFNLTSWGVNPENNHFYVTWVNTSSNAYTGKIVLIYLTMPTTNDHAHIHHSAISV